MAGWIGLYRNKNAEGFSAHDKRIAEIFFEELSWIFDADWPSIKQEQPADTLSLRLQTVFDLQLKGWERKKIAWKLGISENTVSGYIREMYRHFGVNSQPELLHKSRVGGLFSQGGGI